MIINVKNKAIKSVKWAFFAEIATRASQPVVTLILARLLTPADFGLIGMAMIVISLTSIFQNLGLDRALIQRETEVESAANNIFGINVIFSIFLYAILFFAAPLIADFFHEPNAVDLLRVLCIKVILLSVISVHQALMQRALQFKRLFYIRAISSVVPALLSIPLAYLGYGVWALAFGSIGAGIVQAILFFRLTGWTPKWAFDLRLMKELLGFGGWATLESLLAWLLIWGDSVIVGRFLGASELGVYRVGLTLILLSYNLLFGSLTTVAYAAFSRYQSDYLELKRYFVSITQLIINIALPLGVGFVLLAPFISTVVFGQKWSGIESVIAIIAIAETIAWLVGVNPSVYRAVGRPDINAKLLIISVALFIPAYLFAAPHGLLAVCIARVVCTLLSIPTHLFVSFRYFSLSPLYLWDCMKRPLIGIGIMWALTEGAIRLSQGWLPQNWVQFILMGLVSISVYSVTMWIIDRPNVKRTMSLIREAVL